MELRPISQTFAAGVRTHIKLVGRYFRLLSTINPITLEFGVDGRPLAKIDAIEAGIALRRRPDQAEFTDIWITTTGTEAVIASVGDGEITYDPVQKPYYDRNSTPRVSGYAASGVAPHADTQRWTYTVPAGKKTMFEYLSLSVQRKTAAAAAVSVQARVAYVPSGQSGVVMSVVNLYTNAPGDRDKETSAIGKFMGAGDVLSSNTEDLCTGGTITYQSVASMTEFNA